MKESEFLGVMIVIMVAAVAAYLVDLMWPGQKDDQW